MERSMTMPFEKGSVTATMVLTGPITECDGFGLSMDDLFKKVAHDVLAPTIPGLNHLDTRVEVNEGQTMTETILAFDLLGSEIKLTVATTLNFAVDEELVRNQLAMTAMMSFPAKAIDLITEYNIKIIGQSGRVTPKRRSGIEELLGGLDGIVTAEGVLIRG